MKSAFQSIVEFESSAINQFKFINFPSSIAEKYLKNEKDCGEFLEELKRTSIGEVAIDRKTDKLAGYVFVNDDKDIGFIFNLEVIEEYRCNGLGTKLLRDAITKFHGVDLVVDKNNIPAINLYKKNGFNIDSTVSDNNHYYMKLKNA